MDPISQGIVGSCFSQSVSKNKNLLGLVCLIGFLSGMAPDLDIFIRSESDPLLFLEFHRQFTHSLIFIPLGGLACAILFSLFSRVRKAISFRQTWIFSTIGYGTHGLLDSCTSYGTLLFWPFSYERVSWNNVSIIDPLFTIPIVALVFLSILLKKISLSRWAALWALLYLLMGIFLNDIALDAGKEIAYSRGHEITRITAKPTFGNLFLWKVIYETEATFYTDGVRILPTRKIFQGESIEKLDLTRDFLWLKNDSQQSRDIVRFRWFSQDYLAISPEKSNLIIDVRYSILPNTVSGLWGIELHQHVGNQEHVKFIQNRNATKGSFKKLFSLIIND